MNVKKKKTTLLTKCESALLLHPEIAKTMVAAAVTTSCLLGAQTAFAAADPKALVETILDIISKIIVALGGIIAVIGVINYAVAFSEGDGPAKTKAGQQIGAGVMVILLSIALNAAKGTLATAIVG